MRIRTILPEELAWANRQYSAIAFKLSSEADFIAVAEVDGLKAGLGRLTAVEDGVAELGGMYVLPEFRGQNIAASIVEFLLGHSTMHLYCIPFAHLEPFYRRFGFLPADQAQAVPQAVADKFAWCRRAYAEPVALLYRD